MADKNKLLEVGSHDSGNLDLKMPLQNYGNFRAILCYRIDCSDDLFLNLITTSGKNSIYISSDI